VYYFKLNFGCVIFHLSDSYDIVLYSIPVLGTVHPLSQWDYFMSH